MGKLQDWLRGDGDRPRWSRLEYAVAACADDLQDELQDEWNDWTPDKFTGDESEDEFDSCSEWDDGEAVDRAKEWLGWSPSDREADGYGYEQGEDEGPLDDSTYGACDYPRLTDDRRLQDMIDDTPCVVRDFLIAHGRQMAESGTAGTGSSDEDVFHEGYDLGRVEGYATGWRARASGQAPELPELAPAVTTCEAYLAYLVSYPGYRKGLQEELWDEWRTNQDGAAQGAGPSGAQEVGRSEQQTKRQCRFFKQGRCRNGDACQFQHS